MQIKLEKYHGRAVLIVCCMLILLLVARCIPQDLQVEVSGPVYPEWHLLVDRAGLLASVLAVRPLRASSKQIVRSDALADFTALCEAIERIHPDFIPGAAVAESYQSCKDQIDAYIWSQPVSMDRKELIFLLQILSASLDDLHTLIWTRGLTDDLAGSVYYWPPFIVEAHDEQLIVLEGSSELSAYRGKAIVALQELPIEQFLAPALLALPFETVSSTLACLERTQMALWTASGVFENEKELMIQFDDGTELCVSSLKLDDYIDLLDRGSQVRQAEINRLNQTGEYRRLNASTGYLWYPQFNSDPNEFAKLEDQFSRIAGDNPRQLIVDIRGNPGGCGKAVNRLLSHLGLSARSASQDQIMQRLSDDYREQFAHQLDWHREAKDICVSEVPEGLSMTTQYDLTAEGISRYTGEVHLLLDSNCFSASASFAHIFKLEGRGSIWGYESGSSPYQYGNAVRCNLSASGYVAFISSMRIFTGPSGLVKAYHGVSPDHLAAWSQLQLYQTEEDPLLAWVLHALP